MILLAVDPGIRHCGVAVFGYYYDSNQPFGLGRLELEECALIENPMTAGNDACAQCVMACAVAQHRHGINMLVLERQQIYTRDKSPGDPNDLLPLAGVVGGIAALFPLASILNPLPREWKGTVAKEVTSNQVTALLSPAERTIVSAARVPKRLLHNVLDAVGLGLWAGGRLRRRRVIQR